MTDLHSDSANSVETAGFAVSRRSLILAGSLAVIGGAAVFGGSGVFAAAPVADSAGFLQLSQFLTGGQPLPAALATRFQAALARRDPSFDAGVTALRGFVAQAGASTVDDLLTRPDLTEALRKTATKIVSAWYLGIVGSDADAELISYGEALMYRPTMDVLVVPTYGGGPDSWGDKPAEDKKA